MGKPLISQRRGKGSPSFTAPSHRFKARVTYNMAKIKIAEADVVKGKITDIIDDPGRTGLLFEVKTDFGVLNLPACEGIALGDTIEMGAAAKPSVGHVLPLAKIPEGYPVFNLETRAGDGGSLMRASGSCGFVVAKIGDKISVKLPSGQIKYFDSRCMATIGCSAGGGRTQKPILKAGKGHFAHLARGHWYPMNRGVKMSPYDHPFGGKQHHGSTTPKGVGAPSGQHVGSFGAKRTGRTKR